MSDLLGYLAVDPSTLPIDVAAALSRCGEDVPALVMVLHYSRVAYLTLRVKPLGEPVPYKVCWRLKSEKRRCVRGSVDGYSWNDSASDYLSVRLRAMAKRTTFTWYVRGHKVVTRTANTTAR